MEAGPTLHLQAVPSPERGTVVSDHTPGPWEARPSNGSWGERHVVICTPEYPSLPYSYVADITHGGSDPVRAANAALIAASPDLLEALRRYMLYEDEFAFAAEFGRPEYEDSSISSEAFLERVLRGPARAAMAKARGEVQP